MLSKLYVRSIHLETGVQFGNAELLHLCFSHSVSLRYIDLQWQAHFLQLDQIVQCLVNASRATAKITCGKRSEVAT